MIKKYRCPECGGDNLLVYEFIHGCSISLLKGLFMKPELAEYLLSEANINGNVVERKVREAIKKAEGK